MEAIVHRHERGGAVEHGGVDVLALARPLSLQQRADDAEGGHEASAGEVGNEVEGGDGTLLFAAHRLEGAGDGDVVDVVAGRLGQRPFLAPTRERAVDYARVDLVQLLVAGTDAVGHARAESLEDDVGALHHPVEHGLSLGALQVQADGLLAPRQRVAGETATAADGVDADDLRAHVGQEHRAVRARGQPGQVDHGDAIECAHARDLRWPSLARSPTPPETVPTETAPRAPCRRGPHCVRLAHMTGTAPGARVGRLLVMIEPRHKVSIEFCVP